MSKGMEHVVTLSCLSDAIDEFIDGNGFVEDICYSGNGGLDITLVWSRSKVRVLPSFLRLAAADLLPWNANPKWIPKGEPITGDSIPAWLYTTQWERVVLKKDQLQEGVYLVQEEMVFYRVYDTSLCVVQADSVEELKQSEEPDWIPFYVDVADAYGQRLIQC